MDSCAIFYWSSLSMYFSYVPSIIFSFFNRPLFLNLLFKQILIQYYSIVSVIVNVTAAARRPRHPSEGYLRGDLVSVGHQPHPAHACLAHGNPRGLCGFRPPCEVVKGDRFPEIAEVANCVFFR